MDYLQEWQKDEDTPALLEAARVQDGVQTMLVDQAAPTEAELQAVEAQLIIANREYTRLSSFTQNV